MRAGRSIGPKITVLAPADMAKLPPSIGNIVEVLFDEKAYHFSF
jgi:hypothetical protein